MRTGFVVITVLTIVANAFIVIADLARARFVLKNAGELGLSPRLLPFLAVVKGAGVVGLLVGLLWIPVLGTLAATGLTVFYVLAVATHVRAKVFYNLAFPLTFLVLAGATLLLGLRQG